jgi:hypothetical protein
VNEFFYFAFSNITNNKILQQEKSQNINALLRVKPYSFITFAKVSELQRKLKHA